MHSREATASMHIVQAVLQACIADIALMSLQLFLQQCQLYELGGVMFSTLQAFVNAKWQPYMMTRIARRSRHSGMCSFT